jgi:hypothetical protein
MVIRPDSPMVGRVVTAQYMLRPDYDKLIREKGKTEGHWQYEFLAH